MQASFQRQQHIDPRLYLLAQRQGQCTHLKIWIFIEIFFTTHTVCFYRNVPDHIMTFFVWQNRHHFVASEKVLNWLSARLTGDLGVSVKRQGFSQTDVLTSVWVHSEMSCPLFSLQLLLCLLSPSFFVARLTKICSFSQFMVMHFLCAVCDGQNPVKTKDGRQTKVKWDVKNRQEVPRFSWYWSNYLILVYTALSWLTCAELSSISLSAS